MHYPSKLQDMQGKTVAHGTPACDLSTSRVVTTDTSMVMCQRCRGTLHFKKALYSEVLAVVSHQ
jgi:hypothetical protein